MVNHSRTPPIQYLAAFEASARHGSFKAAAEELNITASAISQQIKALEAILGLSLFERRARGIRLNSAGASFYTVAENTIATYKSGFSQFKQQFQSPSLRMTTIPYIANEIIIPNLHRFAELHPDINLIIETSMGIENLADSELDCALRFGIPPWRGGEAKLISKAKSNLVASPKYFAEHPLMSIDDFEHQTIIHTRSDTNDWQRLTDLFNVKVKPKRELHFSSYSAAIKAAEEGLGIAIGLFPTSNASINSGRLVAYAAEHLPLEEAYYLVSNKSRKKEKEYQALFSWVAGVFQSL